MQASKVFWHLANFVALPLVVAGLAACAHRLLHRRDPHRAAFVRLWAWASGAAVVACLAGLAVFTQDGKMATYALMLVMIAVALHRVSSRTAA